MIDRSIWTILAETGLFIVALGTIYLLVAALTLWGLYQLFTGKGRYARDTNRGLGILKVSIGISALGLPALTLAFTLLWLGLEVFLRKQSQ